MSQPEKRKSMCISGQVRLTKVMKQDLDMENSRIWDGKTEDFMQRARGITEQGTHGASGANLKSWKFFTQVPGATGSFC